MEEIDLKLILKYFCNKITTIILVVFLFALIGFAYIKISEKNNVITYKGVSTIIIENNSSQLVIVDGNIEKAKNDFSKVYAEIIKSDEVLNKVIENLDIDYSVYDLKKIIAIESLNNGDAIKIIINNKNKEQAEKITTEISEVFKDKITEIYDIEHIECLTRLEMTNSFNQTNKITTILKFMIIGFILIFVYLFIKYYYDFTIKNINELDDLNLNIVGVITNARRKK